MKEASLRFFHIFSYVLITIFLFSVQTSLWFLIFGQFPPPLFWLYPILFVVLYQKYPQSIFIAYLLAFVASAQTSMPTGIMVTVIMILSFVVRYFKNRIYWEGSSYFALVSVCASAIYPLIYWLISLLRELNPLPYPQFWPALWQVILAPLFAPIFYILFMRLDRACHDPRLAEKSTETV